MQFAWTCCILRPDEKFLDLFFMQQYLSKNNNSSISSELEKPAKPKKSVFKLLSWRGVKANSTPTKSSQQPTSPESDDCEESIASARISGDCSNFEMQEHSTSQNPPEKSLKSTDTTSPGDSRNSGVPSNPQCDIAKSRKRACSGRFESTTRPRYNQQNGENCLIHVGFEQDKAKEFKTILVTNQDRVSDTFTKAMAVLGFETDRPQDYDLAQIIESKKEVTM
ncbi:ral guanine nucleotide dissociation stimulator-like [Stegostoma tigrinum]|uniref:ral guanine nucleotide dissociation stimulator-like n=1 Tax=Stegostoma tigrinum TaxID=3053191 RepID=UPI00287026DE|nr:ral guanine nucleotide dissociation stimulator-like [Stegostoma tigrinum]